MKQTYLITILIFLVHLTYAQHSIKGTVVDNEGQTIPGASILIKGTKEGVVTDIDGKFNLEVPQKDAVLVVSFLGFTKQEVEVGGQSTVDIVLLPDFVELEEIVVVGYGTMRKSDLTGAISSVKVEDNVARQYTTVDQLLNGRAPGVQVISNNANPGAGISVKIRGTNSLRGNNEPLYVVDGVVISSAGEDVNSASTDSNESQSNQNGLNGINPRDIESIEVLKDASATAIYGSRGANGVVLITTKQGVSGETRINAYATSSVAMIEKKLDVLDPVTYAKYQNEGQLQKDANPIFHIENGQIYSIDGGSNVGSEPMKTINWQDEIYQPGLNYNAGVSFGGGSDNGTYYVSAGYNDQSGIVETSKFQSGDIRLNLKQDLTKDLVLDTRFTIFYSEGSFSQDGSRAGGNRGFIKNIIDSAPIIDSEIETTAGDLDLGNPYSFIKDFEDKTKESRIIGSAALTYQLPVKGLKFQVRAGGNIRNKDRRRWYGLTTFQGQQANGVLSVSNIVTKSYTINNLLLFNRTFSKIHRFNTTLGMTFEGRQREDQIYEVQNFSTFDFTVNGAQYGQFPSRPLKTLPSEEQLLSFLGRVNYTLNDKYIITASLRVDGSSKFIKDRYGFFPSLAVAWRLSDEAFVQSLGLFDDLKLRAGVGRIGNQAIQPYQTGTNYAPVYYAAPDNSDNIGFVASNVANPDLTWEKTDQLNVGLDFGVLNNRLTGTVDTYYKSTTDLLQNQPLPNSAGFSSILVNMGEIINRGIELSLSSTAIDKGDFKVSLGANIAFNQTQLGELGIPDSELLIDGEYKQKSFYVGDQISTGTYFKAPANIFIKGEESALFYGWQTDGIYQSTDTEIPTAFQPGDIKIIDQNGDGIIDDKDRTIIGNPNPDFIYGGNININYKRFSLNLVFEGSQGNDIVNGSAITLGTAEASSRNIFPAAYHEAWRPDRETNTFPRVGYSKEQSAGAITDRVVEDGSYFRLNNVILSYDVPVKNVVSNLNIYASAQNVITLTNYSGYNPVVSSFSGNGLINGVDWFGYPNARLFIIGCNVSF
ncbi:TonB-linked outer membrane protein, SusC/RagA family [Reichenbachiella faecimaris]|uniref:TonB-linked outer membrane protein, SusC/RagA family n=1 Tax=Reichenbachiella faecimaris TaxID=692418 RepID=A0A1W2GB15_REIFA|nr:TonB-dependent receptor [Reichenbachiella faecimaris]SMD33855.1 TonB-linked outer membrane protein, SusC/RagA family [Reichenbachiella faecimaris]